ncbi:MAG: hypothetical protein HOO67_07520 [Candidatus Peribacteraceae bacterium]|nr:hypothetical protein [Candidatus Peribacteraceae bacterium]
MKHTPLFAAIAAIVLFLFLSPMVASAHEHRTFTIGSKQYSVVIGSLNEPVRVGDKSGVELTVSELSTEAHETTAHVDGDEHPAETPVTGLEETLKVEVSAGDQKMMFDLRAQYGKPGSYSAVFYPTMQTTYTYKVTGTINGVAVDIPFVCNPAGHPATPEDVTPVKITDAVTQTLKSGAFGCPQSRTDVEFPTVTSGGGFDSGMLGTLLGLAGILLGATALLRVRTHHH